MYIWIWWLICLLYFCSYYVGYMYILWQKLCLALNVLLLVFEWTLYIWPNKWQGSKRHEETMVHDDSQISMRSLHLILLFTSEGYMFMICLMKCLSWLVRVSLRSWSTICFCIIISLYFTWFWAFIPLWVVAWAIGLKKWLNSWGRWHRTGKFGPYSLADRPMRATLGLWLPSCP